MPDLAEMAIALPEQQDQALAELPVSHAGYDIDRRRSRRPG